MTHIQLRNVQKFFGPLQVIRDMNLAIEVNEFIVMLGQSGCGKTTTLRAVAGLETIDEGDILIDGKPVQHLKAADRDIAFVFQSFSLYPHMTVYENIAFPLRATRMGRTGVDQAVRKVADVLRITPLLRKRPSALSGGDMQRVAIGRALVRRPKAMLMDEPIGALDAKLREQMRAEIKRLHIAQGSTTIYVTHDQVEAMSLADRIVVMHEGRLQQVGSPDDVYERPANLFVAQFVGSPVMNVAEATVSGDGGGAQVRLKGAPQGFPFPPELLARLRERDGLALGIRPEGVLVAREAGEGYLPVEAQIIEPLGSHDIVDLRVGEGLLRARTASGFVAGPGERVWARVDPAQAHFFDTASGESLGVPALMARVELQGISKAFGRHQALRGLDLDVADGDFFVLLGETGAGKTTTLRLIAGLETPTEGRILIDGGDVAAWGAAERDVALVLQQYSLYPRLTVRENLEFPLKSKLRRVEPAERAQRVTRAAETLRITHLLDRKTDRLSGGEMQRVSIGRAIVRQPRIFLMDEPLSALDAKLRESLRTELKNLQMTLGATFLFVTHDQIEAMSMGDRIGVLDKGRLVQTGSPHDVYTRPRNTFVARAVGSPPMNLFEGRAADGRAVVAPGFELPLEGGPQERPLIFGIRPEDIRLEPGGPVEARVHDIENHGVEKILTLRVGERMLHATVPARTQVEIEDAVRFAWNPRKVVLFDGTSEVNLTHAG